MSTPLPKSATFKCFERVSAGLMEPACRWSGVACEG
jgi:hypothetical protein